MGYCTAEWLSPQDTIQKRKRKLKANFLFNVIPIIGSTYTKYAVQTAALKYTVHQI